MRRLSAVLAFALVTLIAAPVAAIASPSLEREAVDLLNGERTSRGLPPLTVRSDLTTSARAHSGVMASSGNLHHNPNLSSEIKNWSRIAENVGYGPSVNSIHRALMNSTGHRANILDHRVTEIGIGVVTRGNTTWTTQVFRLPQGTPVPSAPGTASYAGFFDVRAGTTHASAIKAMVDRKITDGCSPGRYCPDAAVTRAQLATFLSRALDIKPVSGRRFSDVTPGSTHSGEIAALSDRGIIRGCTSNRYCPNEPVTRAQMATMLTRAFKWDLATPNFRDVPRSGTHSREIGGTARVGVTKGCATGRFCPSSHVTRAEMASFLDRAHKWRR